MSVDPHNSCADLFATAIDAHHPQQVLKAHLPKDRSGRVIVIGAGKAAAAMAQVVERCWQGEGVRYLSPTVTAHPKNRSGRSRPPGT